MTSFQGSSEFRGDRSNPKALHTLEPQPSVGRFPSPPPPSPLSVLGSTSYSASSRNVSTIAPPQSLGHAMAGNLAALPYSAQPQAQLHREQGNLRRNQGNAGRQLFNPVPRKKS